MPAALSICTQCGTSFAVRRRKDLADELAKTIELSEREGCGLPFLKANLKWFECELRGFCTDCTLSNTAASFVTQDRVRP